MNSRTKVALLTAAVIVAIMLIAAATVLAQEEFTVTWSQDPPTGIAGEPLLIRVSVHNHDTTDVSADTRLSLGTGGLTAIDGGGNWSGCTFTASPPEVSCTNLTFESEDTFEFFLLLDVPSDFVTGSDLAREVEAFYTHRVSDTLDSNHGVAVFTQADLAVTKLAKPDFEVRAGENFTYTIFVDNFGPSDARDVVVTDDILSSAEFELVGLISAPNYTCTTTGSGASRNIVCERTTGALVAGGRDEIKLTVTSDTTSTIDNTVLVTSLEPDPDVSNNTAHVFTSVTDVADLEITKIADDYSPYAGESVQFTMRVTNTGPSTATNVVVEDLLRAGVTVESVSASSGSCTTGIPGDPLAPLTCNLGDIPPGQSRTINVEVQIDPDYVDPELPSDYLLLENDVWVYSDIFDPDNSDNRVHVILDVYTRSDLFMSKWGSGPPWDPDHAVAGEELEYHVRVRNLGPSTAHNFHFVDPLPPEVTFLDYSIEQGTGTCFYHDPLPFPFSGPGVHCYLDDIRPGGVNVVHLQVLVNPDVTERFCNAIPEGAWFADSYVEVIEGSELEWCAEVDSQADLSIEKTSEPPKIYPGEQKVYHITITNHGPADAQSVVVSDTLPMELRYQIDTDNCDVVDGPPDLLRCDLGTIPAGESVQFDIHALVDPGYPVTQTVEITNGAEVWMETEEVWDPNRENNSDWTTNLILVPNSADLGIDKWWYEAPSEWFDGVPWDPEDCILRDEFDQLYGVRAGCPLRYGLVVTNTGPLLAENVVMEDLLPAGVVVEGVGAPGSCTTGIPGDPSAPLTCNLGNIPPGEDRWIEVFVMTDADLAGEPLENDAVVSSDIFDPDNGNNRAHVLIWVEPFSYLSLMKGGPDDIMAGEEIHYHIDINNQGPSTAHDVYLNDELPGGVSLLGAEVMIGDGSCTPDTALCSLGDMEPWGHRSVRVRGYVEPWLEEGTLITNTVEAWAHSPFNSPNGPISDTWPTLVHSEADLSIRKTGDPYKVYAGEQKRYDIEVTNHGPGVAYNVVVSDTLPPGVEFEIATIGCEYTPTMMLGSTTRDDGSLLVGLDLDTAAPTVRGSLPDLLGADIEYDALSSKLYASMGSAWDSDELDSPQLHTIDPETGDSLGFVELDQECALPALEFVGSTLYATCHTEGHSGGSYLVTVDPTTGHVTTIGPTDRFRIHGLAYDEEAGVMYGVTYHDDDAGDLVSIDLGTGAASTVCSTYREDITALDYGPGGILYAGIGGDHGTDRDLLTIDTETCDMTLVGETDLSIVGLTWLGQLGDGALECPLGNIPPGETSAFSIWVRVKPSTLGMINNQVDVSSDNDTNPDNDHWSEANLVLGKADLRVLKYGKPDGIVEAGDRLTYTVIVDNLGPGYAHDVVLYDLFSSSSWAYYVDDWRSDRPADCSWDEWGRDTRITCHLDDPLEVMSPSSSGRWVLKFYLEVFEEQSVNNVADVVAADFDPDLSNNHAITEHEITAVADLELNKIAEGEVLVGCDDTDLVEDEVAAGGELTYVLEVYNDGPSTAENVVIEDWGLSPFLDIISVECHKDWSGGSCSCITSDLGELGDTDRRLECNLGTVYPWYYNGDEPDRIIITARVPSDVPEGTRLVNDARVYGDVFDDDNGDNLDTNWTTVIATADLEVEKTQEPETTLPSWEVTYTITVTNFGPSDAHGVIVSDTLPFTPTNVTVECCASDGGDCDVPCEPPICPPGDCPWPDVDLYVQADIPAGGWVIYTLTATPEWVPCEMITNTVEVIAPLSVVYEDDIDPCDGNNVDYTESDPECNYVPLALKQYGGPDSTP